MNWANLKENKCPQCNEDLAKAEMDRWNRLVCDCGFKITERRMGELVSKMVRREDRDRFREEENNLNELSRM